MKVALETLVSKVNQSWKLGPVESLVLIDDGQGNLAIADDHASLPVCPKGLPQALRALLRIRVPECPEEAHETLWGILRRAAI